MLKDLLKRKNPDNHTISAEEQFQQLVKSYNSKPGQKQLPKVIIKKFNLSHIVYEFYGQAFDINTPGIMALCFIVGIIGGVYGIGGGAIIAPFFVGFFGLPVYTIAGAALMGTFVTSVAGVIFYQAIAPFYPDVAVAPDWALGFLFGIGGFGGMYCGARLQKFVPAKRIKWILVVCLLFASAKYIIDFLK